MKISSLIDIGSFAQPKSSFFLPTNKSSSNLISKEGKTHRHKTKPVNFGSMLGSESTKNSSKKNSHRRLVAQQEYYQNGGTSAVSRSTVKDYYKFKMKYTKSHH